MDGVIPKGPGGTQGNYNCRIVISHQGPRHRGPGHVSYSVLMSDLFTGSTDFTPLI